MPRCRFLKTHWLPWMRWRRGRLLIRKNFVRASLKLSMARSSVLIRRLGLRAGLQHLPAQLLRSKKSKSPPCRKERDKGGAPSRVNPVSTYLFGPGFKVLLYFRHELVGYCAIDEAVVVT